jgi:hypothetical protein
MFDRDLAIVIGALLAFAALIVGGVVASNDADARVKEACIKNGGSFYAQGSTFRCEGVKVTP